MQWIKDLTLRTKLIAGFCIVAFIAGTIGVVGIVSLQTADESDTILYEKETVPIMQLSEVSIAFQRVRVSSRDMIMAATPEARQDAARHIDELSAIITANLGKYAQSIMTEEGKRMFEELARARVTYRGHLNDILADVNAGRITDAVAVLNGPGKTSATAEQAIIDSMMAQKVKLARERSEGNTVVAIASIREMAVLMVVGVILALGLGLLIARMVSTPVKQLAAAAAKVALGDLDVSVQQLSKDEVGDLTHSFNQMVDGIRNAQKNLLREKAGVEAKVTEAVATIKQQETYLASSIERMMKEITKLSHGDLRVHLDIERDDEIGQLFTGFNDSIAQIRQMLVKVEEALSATASASAQISSSTEEMAAGAEEQTQQATEVAGAVEEMSKTIVETTRNASLAAETARKSGKDAHEGGRVVRETIHGMTRIATVVKESAETVQALGRSSDQIGEIIQVIDDIADQTNLLALNAAIEAARAGEQGRGFAVVADEVRKLAERTTKATKEIASMIKKIQTDTANAVESMRRGTEEVEAGRLLAERLSDSLTAIIEGSEKVVDVVSQVAAASEEQASASEEISKSIEAISSVTQESAAGVQEIARAAGDLNLLTKNLQELLAQFSLDDGKASPEFRRGAANGKKPVTLLSASRPNHF